MVVVRFFYITLLDSDVIKPDLYHDKYDEYIDSCYCNKMLNSSSVIRCEVHM